MKLLLTSPKALLYDDEKTINCGVIHSFQAIVDSGRLQRIGIISSNKHLLNKLDLSRPPFYKIHLERGEKQKKDFVADVINKSKGFLSSHNDIIVLAANDGDARMCWNNNLLMLSARWIQRNHGNKGIFEYGISLDDPGELNDFVERFIGVSHDYYYSLDIPNTQTWMYSLTKANTMGNVSQSQVALRTKMREQLKDNRHAQLELAQYFIVAMYAKLDILKDIDYWTVYPSSQAGEYNEILLSLKEDLRLLYKKRAHPEILVRHTTCPKRHKRNLSVQQRCDSQFETLHLDSRYRDKLKGKVICILDDFTTTGSSCEVARHLLTTQGAEKVIFITMGKFSHRYTQFDYTIEGDVFGTYEATYNKQRSLHGTFNELVSAEVKQVLGDVL